MRLFKAFSGFRKILNNNCRGFVSLKNRLVFWQRFFPHFFNARKPAYKRAGFIFALFFLVIIGFNGLPAYEILLKAINAINGRTETVSLYPGACYPQSIPDDYKSGWWNAENAAGEPQLGPQAGMLDFSDENSAFYTGGAAGLICGDFMFLTTAPAGIVAPPLTPLAGQPDEGLPLEAELEIIESPVLYENKPAEGEAGSETFTAAETDEQNEEENGSEQATAEAETGAPQAEEISTEDKEEIKVEIIDLDEINAEPVIEAGGLSEEDGNNAGAPDELSVKARLLAGLKRSLNGLFRRSVVAQEAIISPVDSLVDLGVFKSAQIYFSFAMSELSSSVENEKPEPAAERAPSIDEQEISEEDRENDVSINDEQGESPEEPEAGVEIIEWPDYAEGEASEPEIFNEESGAEMSEDNAPAESDSAPTARNMDIFGPLWALAQTEDFLSAGRLAIWYTLDKGAGEHALWHRLDVLRGYVATNALKGGYFSYDAPFLENWQDVANLQIKFEGLLGEETRFIAYLDSVWVEAVYEPVTELDRLKKRQRWEEALKLVSDRPDLRADEGGELRFRYEKNTSRLLERVGDLFGLNNSGFWQDVDIDIKLLDPRGRTIDYPLTVIFAQDGEFTVRLERPAPPFRPGRYTLKFLITDQSGNEPETLEINQDFTWGVLAINLNKSIYLPGDSAYLQMAVLDERGDTLCNADLSLEITAPDNGRAVLDTENGLVILNSACGRNNVIDTPDYYAYYTVGRTGEYDIRLTASTSNGIYSITDRFEVRDHVPFDIERIGPTRIYPPAEYQMTVKITANEDFTGSINEFVPESFNITNEYNANDANDMRMTRITNDANNGTKMIIWENINLKQGEEAEITYSFKAPDRWPEFYLLGPLELEEAEPLRSEDRSGSASFAEIRYWQIAADAVVVATSTNGTHNGWTNPSNAWDNTNNTHASRLVARRTGTSPETGNYLESTANSAKNLGGKINSVEIGIEGYRDTTDVTAYLLPRFNGTTNGDQRSITNLPTGSDGDTTHYVDITEDSEAPATWTWADIINLDIRVYGGNNSNGQDRTLYIDQIRIRVDYTPNNAPTSTISRAEFRADGSGVVDMAIKVNDPEGDDQVRAKMEYVLGADCNFASPLDPTLDETDANATSTYGDAKILNANEYQIGNSSGWIQTSSGENTVNFDWQSKTDLPLASSTYCIRVTAHDGFDVQSVPATTTVYIKNYPPIVENVIFTPSSGLLKIGDTATATIYADAAGYTAGAMTINSKNVAGSFTDIGGGAYQVAYTVTEGDTDRADSDDLPVSFILKDGYNNSSAAYTAADAAGRPGVDANRPVITQATVPNTAYKINDTVTITVNVQSDADTYTLYNSTVNGVTVTNLNKVNNTTHSVFYTVSEGDTDRSAGTIPINISFADSAGNVSTAVTSLQANTASIDANRPVIEAVAIPDLVYKIGSLVRATVTVAVDPDVYTVHAATINEKSAGNLQKINNTTYTIDYTVASGDTDRSAGTIPFEVQLKDPAGQYNLSAFSGQSGGAIDANAPAITAVSFTPSSGVLKVGDTATATITALNNETGLLAGPTLTINGQDVSATFTELGSGQYRATYLVEEGDTDRPDSEDLPVNLTLADQAGNISPAYTTADPDNRPGVDANTPAISAVSFAPASGVLKVGDTATATITALNSETGLLAGPTLTINGQDVSATFTELGSGQYRVIYLIEEGDTDRLDSEDLPVNLTLADQAGNISPAYTTADPDNRPGVDANTPAITAVSFLPSSGLLKVGDKATATIAVAGAETGLLAGLIMTINNVDVSATFTDIGSGNYRVVYTVSEGDSDVDDSADLPVNLTIQDSAGNISPAYTTADPDNRPGVDANTPAITTVSFTPSSGILKVGDTATATITALNNETGLLTGPTLTINSADVLSTFTELGGGQYRLVYTVQEGDNDVSDATGLAVNLTLADPAGNISAAYTTADPDNRPGVDANTPAITAVSFMPSSGVLKVGDTATATISVAGTETGLLAGPTMTINNVDVSATFTDIGSGNYRVVYTVSEGNSDVDDSADLPVNLTIQDAAGNISAAYTTADPSNRPGVDANTPAITAVSFTPSSGVLKVGDTATATISVAGAETGLLAGPTLTINGKDVSATFTEVGGGAYRVTYLVEEGDTDRLDSEDLPVNLTLADQAGNISPAYTTADPDNRPGVDANTPTPPGNLSFYDHDNTSITLIFGNPATDDNFFEYKLFYKIGSSGVTEGDAPWTAADDLNLGDRLYNGATTTTITGLAAATDYVFNIWAYDAAGNKASAAAELAASTNYPPASPTGLVQFRSDGLTVIPNGGWQSEGSVKLSATAADPDAGEIITVYFELATSTDSFGGNISSPCAADAAWAVCANKVWATTSPAGDYAVTPFAATVSPSGLYDSAIGYKWRVMVCDEHASCSDWVEAGASPNFRIDQTPPSAPGDLSLESKTSVSVTLYFGTETDEDNFREYIIYYKIGNSGVTESDYAHGSSTDPSLGFKDYDNSATTTIGGLSAGTGYVFNIYAYDQAGNKASATEITVTTDSASNPPTAVFKSAAQKTDGSGQIAISIEVDDPDNDNTVRARIEYAAGADCDFSSPARATVGATTTAAYGNPIIDNNHDYQVGTSSGYILTSYGPNTVDFDWLSKTDAPSADGIYCLRLTANDGTLDQAAPATTTVYIDNTPPSAPGDLVLAGKTSASLTLYFGAASIDTNFSRYRVFYKAGTAGVTENDSEHFDANLNDREYNAAATTTISGLELGTEYVINIWAYDEAGNKASATEMTAATNYAPDEPVSLGQFEAGGLIALQNGAWTSFETATLAAAATDSDENEVITLYFELLAVNDDFTTATTAPAGACASTTAFATCPSKIWAVSSSAGDFRVTPFRATATPASIPDSSAGYKWQVLACDADGACSEWTRFNNETPNFRLDNTPPTAPGPLTPLQITAATATLNLNATTSEANFREYRIYYKKGQSGVTESDTLFASSSDPNLGAIDYSGAATVQIGGLDPGEDYVFNIWAYDQAGNKASGTPLTVTMNNYPSGYFLLANQRTTGTGRTDISIIASDPDGDESRAKIEYVSGVACDFSAPSRPTLDETDLNATSTYGDAKILNANEYQVGNSAGWIITSSGENTVSFDWLSKTDLPTAEGIYCLRLTVNDQADDQIIPATTTVYIDNKAPTAPGNLSLHSRTGPSLTLNFGAPSTETNFSRYRLFYKKGVANVTESDPEHIDANLDYIDYNGAATTTISGLDANSQYSFRIYAYDQYGNKANSDQVTFTTNARPTGSFSAVTPRTDGSGRIDIAISVYDVNGDESRAKLEYVAGAACDFSSPAALMIDDDLGSITATYGAPRVDNSQSYQIGTSTGWIITSSGANTVNFNWLSGVDLPGADGIYCLRLVVNDGVDDQTTPATTTVTVDNAAPDVPGGLSALSAGYFSVNLGFGAPSQDSRFAEYRIYYKEGAAGATENDSLWGMNDDANLGQIDYGGAPSTLVTGLQPDTQYVFNIWAYDTYGNKTAAAAEVATTTAFVLSATWREDEDAPSPTTGRYVGKGEPVRLRLAIANTGDWTADNRRYRIEYAVKDGDCAAADGWSEVPAQQNGGAFAMVDSAFFENLSSTTARLINTENYNFTPGYMVKNPYNATGYQIIGGGDYTELEYAFSATPGAGVGESYCFRLTHDNAALERYSHYPVLTIAPPIAGSFASAALRRDGTGRADISITMEDPSLKSSRARIEYAGADCDFSSPLKPALDDNPANISATYGAPRIDNSHSYQVGTTSYPIVTEYGANTVNFDWLTQTDLPAAEGVYCLRLTANDGYDDQPAPATTTLTIDNRSPSVPGDLTLESRTMNSVTLKFGASSSDAHFREYKIFYKEGSSGVTEADSPWASSSDPNLGFMDYNGAQTTTIGGLTENKQYVFRIWAYDEYGNKAASAGEVTARLVPTISGTLYSDTGSTTLLSAPTVTIAINGMVRESKAASAQDGRYIFYDIDPPAAGSPMVVYLDDSPEKGAVYIRYGQSGEISDLDLYQNHVIVRHDDEGPITLSDLDAYDSDQDNDIPCTVTGAALTVPAPNKLIVWPGSTFNVGVGDLNLSNVQIDGILTANLSQNIAVSGNWDASEGVFNAASSTVEFTANTAGRSIIANGHPFWNLKLSGAGDWTLQDAARVLATTTIAAGELIQGGNIDFETRSLVIAAGAVFTKASGTGLLVFEGDGADGIFEDLNDPLNDLGNVQIGYSPAVTRLNSNFSATSLTINSNDRFYTRGYDVTVTNFITVNGTYDCTDDKAGDGTITTLGTDWTVAPGATFVAANSTTTLSGAGASTLSSGGTGANHRFYNLVFAKTSLATTTFANYDVKAQNHVIIGANSIVDVSGSNYNFMIGGDYRNSGSYLARQATTTFDSAITGRVIDPGASPFYNAEFNSLSGGWTIAGHATSTNNWTLAALSSFTVSAGKTVEVQGEYRISDGVPAATAWENNATLFLNNGGAYTIGSKTQSAESYGVLKIGEDTDVRMWNSTSTSYIVDPSGSLYSQDHNNLNGALYIWGDYRRESGTEYWSYAADFDGADISASPRPASVRLAAGASAVINGADLEILGAAGATTTIANQGSGSYALNIINGGLLASYYEIRNMDASGLNLSETVSVTSLDYGDFELAAAGGSLITVSSSTVGANPGLTISGCRFATSTGINSGYNVALNGVPASGWYFTSHYGNLAGEDHDSDPGDPRGYLVWDDSPEYSPASQNWRFYHDEDEATPLAPAAGENYAPAVDGRSTMKLRLTIDEAGGFSGLNVKMRLQYSTMSDFSADVNFVGEIGSSTALWTYYDGADISDNDPIAVRLLSDSTAAATHNESGVSASTFEHTALTPAEWEFTIYNNGAATSTTYYFRAYANYYSIYDTFEKAVLPDSGASYPSVLVSDAALSFSIAGVPAGTFTEGVVTDIETATTSVSFGTLPFGASRVGAHRFTITTNAESGYQLFVMQRQDLVSRHGYNISPVPHPNENPSAWPANPSPSAFGYHTGDENLSGLNPSRFANNNSYARFETNKKEVSYSAIPVEEFSFDLVYRIEVDNSQAAGDYITDIVYVLVPTF